MHCFDLEQLLCEIYERKPQKVAAGYIVAHQEQAYKKLQVGFSDSLKVRLFQWQT